MQKIERLVAITLLLQARGKLTARYLAGILGVSTRTIYRDITDLSLAHVPISMDFGPGGGYYLPEDFRIESAIFTRAEAISLILNADIAGNYSLFAGDDDLHRALYKLEAALPEEYRDGVRLAREHFLIDSTAWYASARSSPYLETIRSAVLGAYQLDILYSRIKSDGMSRSSWQRVEPHGIVFKGMPQRHTRAGIWYLVAYSQDHQDFNVFRIGQIEKLRELCSKSITPKPDFDLQTYWEQTGKYLAETTEPFTMKLQISAPGRPSLRGNYTILREEPDGSIVVNVDVESFEAAVSYVLALRAQATVILPQKLRMAVAETARRIFLELMEDNAEA
ncbi:MAG TPA: YafY family protein [Ktedonobacteraceae bacterium]|jgi:predicted DNA-binding transcriptional regulator YafY